METVFGVERYDKRKFEESGVQKSSPDLVSRKQIGSPIVYKLVRVEGDGRLIPATHDEIMEVKDLLEDEKSEMHAVEDTEQQVECISNEGLSSGKPQSKSSAGLLQLEHKEADGEKLNARLEYIEGVLQKVKQEEKLRLAYGSADHSSANVNVDNQCSDQCDLLYDIDEKLQSEIPLQASHPFLTRNRVRSHPNRSVVKVLDPPDKLIEGCSSISVVCTSEKPDFSKLKGEVCLESLSIKELHETFKATFGRETSVKDKQWLKRRIAMGLTNSCAVTTTSFIINENELVRIGEEERCSNVDGVLAKDSLDVTRNDIYEESSTSPRNLLEYHQSVSGKRLRDHDISYDNKCEDLHADQTAVKRVRKPTKRYIEELSEAELKEQCGKLTSARNLGLGFLTPKPHVRPVRINSSDGRTILTRLDSLGGSGIHVPCVSRIRRSRPRKNIKALMKFHQSCVSTKATPVKDDLDCHYSQSNSESENGSGASKATSTSELMQQSFVAEPEKNKRFLIDTVDVDRQLGPKHDNTSGETSDENILTVPTAKGGIRRKHHRAWSLSEVMKLVEGVARHGAGRWSEIKRLAFASYSYRTSVHLKDKWRNLLKASFAQTPSDKGLNSRKHASMPVPASILLRVRELAEMHGAPNVSSSKLGGGGGGGCRNVDESESRSGYL